MADPEPVDLDFLADRLRYLIAEVASLRDGMSVLTAMVLRQDGTMNALLQEIRATISQIAQMNQRLRQVEEARG